MDHKILLIMIMNIVLAYISYKGIHGKFPDHNGCISSDSLMAAFRRLNAVSYICSRMSIFCGIVIFFDLFGLSRKRREIYAWMWLISIISVVLTFTSCLIGLYMVSSCSVARFAVYSTAFTVAIPLYLAIRHQI